VNDGKAFLVLRALARQIATEEERKANEAMLERFKLLAIVGHKVVCSCNHAEECSWDYEIRDGEHDWEAPSHSGWLHYIKQSGGAG
jgi:hypothetical protein